MCLEHSEMMEWWERSIVEVLSHFRVTGTLRPSSRSPMIYQLACLAVNDRAMYSASVVEIERECCLVERQKIRQDPKRNPYLNQE